MGTKLRTLHHRLTVVDYEGKEVGSLFKQRVAAHDVILLQDVSDCNLATAAKLKSPYGFTYNLTAMAPTHNWTIDDLGQEFLIRMDDVTRLRVTWDSWKQHSFDLLDEDGRACGRVERLSKAPHEHVQITTEASGPVVPWV